jgi:hypothetical protein
MANIIIAYDNADESIGANCLNCYLYFSNNINLSPHNVQTINGENCTKNRLQEAITSLREDSFILIAYSHGREDALYSSAEPNGYVTSENAYYFAKSLVYTNSCHSAKMLKQYLIDSNCFCFVGYQDIVRVPENSKYEHIFIECENKGISHFLTTGDSIFESVQVMKEHYIVQSRILSGKDFLLASRLLRNMEAIDIGGDAAITINNLI